jgi:predicted nucleotidyltransferase
MRVSEGTRSTDELLALVDAVVYADVFDSTVTLDELHRYARVLVDRASLEQVLADDPVLRTIVVERDGTIALRGRSEVFATGADRAGQVEHLRRRARRVARVLCHTPFVRGISLTGSVAAGDARDDSDVDMLLVVAPGRLGTVFALLGTVSRIVGRRVFCPNFYLSENNLTIRSQSIYVAREVAQTESLAGDAMRLREANPWVEAIFPNLPKPTEPRQDLRTGGFGQHFVEALLGGRIGDRFERWARELAHRRLQAHYGGLVPSEITRAFDAGEMLRFHRGDIELSVPRRYEARREEVANWLQAPPTGSSS